MTETRPRSTKATEPFPRGSGDAAFLRTRARRLTSPLFGTGSDPSRCRPPLRTTAHPLGLSDRVDESYAGLTTSLWPTG